MLGTCIRLEVIPCLKKSATPLRLEHAMDRSFAYLTRDLSGRATSRKSSMLFSRKLPVIGLLVRAIPALSSDLEAYVISILPHHRIGTIKTRTRARDFLSLSFFLLHHQLGCPRSTSSNVGGDDSTYVMGAPSLTAC